MDDLYAQTFGWNPHRSQRDPFCCPVYPQYEDYSVFIPLASRMSAVTRKAPIYPYDSDEKTDSDGDLYPRTTAKKAERAAETKVKATAEYEKAKVKVDEAKKALEECEAKLKEASRKLAKYAKVLEERRYAIRYY